MKGKTHKPEQIIAKLSKADEMFNTGSSVGEVYQNLAISGQTFHRWRQQYGGMTADAAKKLKELEQENQRLKRGGLAVAGQPEPEGAIDFLGKD